MKKLIVCVIAVFFMSCEKILMKAQPNNNPKAIFDQVWNFVNDKYSFFDYKKVDWDKAYKTYSVKVTDTMDEEALFKVCYDMLYELKDEHVNLISKFNVSRNPEVFLDYPENFSSDLLTRSYFKGRTQRVSSFSYFDFNDVAFVSYRSFLDEVNDDALNYLIKKANTKKGLILDVRDNGGGAVVNIDLITERFIKEKTFFGREFHKNSSKKDDYTIDSVTVEPNKKGEKYFNKPIVILTNRGCYSATNRFAAYMKGLPNVTLVGGLTGGGGGLPTSTELANGWVLRVSGSQFYDRKGLNIENGVTPDIAIDMTKADSDNGKDTILERGLSIIRK